MQKIAKKHVDLCKNLTKPRKKWRKLNKNHEKNWKMSENSSKIVKNYQNFCKNLTKMC